MPLDNDFLILKKGPSLRTGPDSSGGGEGSRTPDTGIFSPLLYQLSYPAIWCGNYYTKLDGGVKDFFRLFGASERHVDLQVQRDASKTQRYASR